MRNKKIVLLAQKGNSTNIIYNILARKFPIDQVFFEQKVNKLRFLKRRVKKLGWTTVTGQILFQTIVVNLLSFISKKRVADILTKNNLSTASIPDNLIVEVPSVNSEICLDAIKKLLPDVVIINGTRILSKKAIESINCPIINMHAGITPKYRGVHGAYWALTEDDPENCGVTIHLIDPGIDTGGILYQKKITPIKQDNFTTYPLLQIAAGADFLLKAVSDALEGKIKTIKGTQESKLWYHPSIGQYLRYYLIKGVK